MKPTFYLKLTIIIYMIISSSVIECINIRRIKKKSSQLRAQQQQTSQQKQFLNSLKKFGGYQKLLKEGYKIMNQKFSYIDDKSAILVKEFFELLGIKYQRDNIKIESRDEPQYKILFQKQFNNIEKNIEEKIEKIKTIYEEYIQKLSKTIQEQEQKSTKDQQKNQELKDIEGEEKTNKDNLKKISEELQVILKTEQCYNQLYEIESNYLELQGKKSGENGITDLDKEQQANLMQKEIISKQRDCFNLKESFLNDVNQRQKPEKSLQQQAYEMVAKQIEEKLPPQFCYNIASFAKKRCKDENDVMGYFYCKKKCPSEFKGEKVFTTRNMLWCVEDCNPEEQQQKTCQTGFAGLRIYKKTTNNKWDGHWRKWYRSDLSPNLNYEYYCDKGFEPKKVYGLFTKCHKPQAEQCENIGYQQCGPSYACALNKKECANTALKTLLAFGTGVLKLVMFIMTLGTGNIGLEAIKKGFDLASSIASWTEQFRAIAEQINKSLNFFADVHDNPVQREILIHKIFKEISQDEEKFEIFKLIFSTPRQRSNAVYKKGNQVNEPQSKDVTTKEEPQQEQEINGRSRSNAIVKKGKEEPQQEEQINGRSRSNAIYKKGKEEPQQEEEINGRSRSNAISKKEPQQEEEIIRRQRSNAIYKKGNQEVEQKAITQEEQKLKQYIRLVVENEYIKFKKKSWYGKLANVDTLLTTLKAGISTFGAVVDSGLKNEAVEKDDIEDIIKGWHWLDFSGQKQETVSDELKKNAIYTLFQADTFVAFGEVLEDKLKNGKITDHLGLFLGIAQQFDPTGVLSIIKAFVYDFCYRDQEVMFTTEEIKKLKTDQNKIQRPPAYQKFLDEIVSLNQDDKKTSSSPLKGLVSNALKTTLQSQLPAQQEAPKQNSNVIKK